VARRLKSWLRSYMLYTEHSESPDRFHFWTAVSTIAGALRRKVWIDMGYFEWTPNFFIFLVAPPGIVSKSTSANIGIDLLREIEGIRFGPSALTWQGLVKLLGESLQSFPMDNNLLGMKFEMCSITSLASELGTFLDPKNREMIDLLVDLWDGRKGSWVKFTKMDGAENIVNPWVNLIACTTPSWIADNVNNQFIKGGFASRSVFIFSDVKRKLVAYPFRHLPKDHSQLHDDLVADLRHIAEFRGEFKLTPEAIEWGEAWYAKHYDEIADNYGKERLEGYFARKQTHVHKLAMVLSASVRDDMLITATDLQSADKALTSLEVDMPRVFSHMNREQLADYASEALQLLHQKGLVARDVFFRECFMRKVSYETFNKMLDSLVNSNLVIQAIEGNKTILKINEAVLEKATKNVSNS
jgi:Protein of unknown function (DUF3987)